MHRLVPLPAKPAKLALCAKMTALTGSVQMAATVLNSIRSLCLAPQDLRALRMEAPPTVQAASFRERETRSAPYVREDTSVRTRNTLPFRARLDTMLLHKEQLPAPYVHLATDVQILPKHPQDVNQANMLQPQVSISVLTVRSA